MDIEELVKFQNSVFWNDRLELSFKSLDDEIEFGFAIGYLGCLLYQGLICLDCFNKLSDCVLAISLNPQCYKISKCKKSLPFN